MHVKCVSVLNLSWQKPSVPSSDCKQTHTMASLLDKTTGGQHFFLKKCFTGDLLHEMFRLLQCPQE